MKLLLAVGHVEIQRFIARVDRIDISEIANSVDELFEILHYSKANTVMLSRYLPGSQNHRLIIERIKTVRPELRIVYLYGEGDSESQAFVEYLESKLVSDYKIGTDISSLELSKLLFGDGKNGKTAITGLFKRQVKTLWYRELDRAVISIYSNSSNGKSHLAWNMSMALARRGYKTTLLNLDRGYSANIYFGIDDAYYDLLNFHISQGEYKNLFNNCCKKGGLNIITGALGSNEQISSEAFQKLLSYARTQSDIVIVDTYTGFEAITAQAIGNSDIDFIIFDCDLMHFHLNKLLLEEMDDGFIDTKTYAVINNCNAGSESYKYIYQQIKKLNYGFKAILPLSSCGSLGWDLMATGNTPYEAVKDNSGFYMDLNNIMSEINAHV